MRNELARVTISDHNEVQEIAREIFKEDLKGTGSEARRLLKSIKSMLTFFQLLDIIIERKPHFKFSDLMAVLDRLGYTEHSKRIAASCCSSKSKPKHSLFGSFRKWKNRRKEDK